MAVSVAFAEVAVAVETVTVAPVGVDSGGYVGSGSVGSNSSDINVGSESGVPPAAKRAVISALFENKSRCREKVLGRYFFVGETADVETDSVGRRGRGCGCGLVVVAGS